MAAKGAAVAERGFRGFRLEKSTKPRFFLTTITKYGVEELPLEKVQMPSQHDHES
jgi:hypothetical protein